ncbi:PadR family transcriptional regulator [Kineococcus aurantiacus]|uniref:DNA-binding PadR family transcriptional regulator n=1 Tax=Kineococcus aurantiacus TaxID=37633 RepID=A0A7Y9DQD9_9ACTN|nr:helix-turn-helix transcriptional regulator [Kineococcus aurantiacus]NYD24797.1 DNA-binding PadR family transcriptional regulator [Kineococcus aurantiacus]
MSLVELHLALLSRGPAHGYDLKREYDAWFPDAKPLAFGQVYATLARLVRDELAEVVETRSEGGPERTVYTVTVAGRQRLRQWLAEPAPPAVAGTEDLVRKTIAALRTTDPERAATSVVADQRTAHLRRMRALADPPGREANPGPGDAVPDEVGARLSRRYALLHLDADLRWLDEAATALETPRRPS